MLSVKEKVLLLKKTMEAVGDEYKKYRSAVENDENVVDTDDTLGRL